MLDCMLRSLMNKDDYMGGKCIVLMGDLRQCPPVVRRGKRAQVAADSIIHGESWRLFKVHRLHKNIRVERTISQYPERKTELMTYASWLLNMGNRKLRGPFCDLIEVSLQLVCKSTRELEDKVFDDFEDNMKDVNYLCQRAIMSTKNDFINEKNQIHGEDSRRNED